MTSSLSDPLLPEGPPVQLSVRSILVGLVVGILLCFTNMYFGLQTGWVTTGSVQAAVVGFVFFRLCWPQGHQPFGALENILLVSVSVATATMPLAAGFVGIIPALEQLGVSLTIWEQILWAGALCYFGIFIAVPLRRQFILVEQLPFPSGTATAKLINLLNFDGGGDTPGNDESTWRTAWQTLICSFSVAFFAALIGFLVPACSTWEVATWLGFRAVTAWGWTLKLDLSLVGQGMIMGSRAGFSMLAGAITSWAFLGPLAAARGWAPGEINDWETGAQGWVLWVSIGFMLSESIAQFTILGLKELLGACRRDIASKDEPKQVTADSDSVPTRWWLGGLVSSTVLCTAILSPMFSIPLWQILFAILLSCFIAALSVRALGETDLNPVSAVGKLSQLVFAVVAPGQVITNIVAGGLAEAAATQAGDLMQTMKAAHLLNASPRVQFFGQILGSTLSVVSTVVAYQLYAGIYGIPSPYFEAPVSHIWISMAKLMSNGLSTLPAHSLYFAAGFAALGFALVALEVCNPRVACTLPSGIAFGIGMYLTPSMTLPRVIGAIVNLAWRHRNPISHEKLMLMVASGFVLGQGVESILQLFLVGMK